MKTIFSLTIPFFLLINTCGCLSPRAPLVLTSEQVIEGLKLKPMSDAACPGFFRATYESEFRAKIENIRPAASLIYYLMTQNVAIDPWHILTSDEIMLYHAGAPMVQMLLYADGTWEELILGPKVDQGQVIHKFIPAGTWMGFAIKNDPNYDWGLYGVMVVPGWHIQDIRMIKPGIEIESLKKKYPAAVQRGKKLGLF
ncbi:MAG: cupin domain-containing protein [Pseudomonadota bacterium]|nr:cupin domain-containing protein [Pseudomonadota bacterium]